ncbi:hypothetical protein V8J82_00680 [Gymnodinialimonas sp. 2305UL16-5]|uniref:hypothetical protein n=1 Tax=Gymnodinialimonas mytili TaxID=3126503 RepID=UPI0030B3E343
MTPLAVIEAIATLLWCYAALTGAAWLARARRLDQRQHVPVFTELLGHLVPAMILLVGVVLVGALVGLPSVVVFIAVLFPAGLAYGLHMALNDLRDTEQIALRTEFLRVGLALLLAALVIVWRGAP